jgi:hypothetical protein
MARYGSYRGSDGARFGPQPIGENESEAGAAQELRALVGGGSPVAANDQVDHREPDSRTGGCGVEAVCSPFKLLPDRELILARNTWSIVVNFDDQVGAFGTANHKSLATAVAEGVDNQVVEGLAKPVGIGESH